MSEANSGWLAAMVAEWASHRSEAEGLGVMWYTNQNWDWLNVFKEAALK